MASFDKTIGGFSVKDYAAEQAEINQKFEAFSKEMLNQLLTDGDTKDGFYKMLDPQYLMSEFSQRAKEGKWLEAAKYCFMLNHFTDHPDAQKVDFIHRAKVYIIAYVGFKRWQGELWITRAIPIGIKSTKEDAEKQLTGYVNYINEEIGCFRRYDHDLDKWVPTYTERKGDPKPVRIEAKSEYGTYQIQTFSNYPQFKVGYIEVEIQ
jgi:hypothetical protein